jgi:hypothetical protein
MWRVAGDVSFWAEDAGATSVKLLDGIDPSEEFIAAHARRGSKVRYVQGDLHERETLDLVGEHDVVWCTGVLYHTPHLLLQLEHLRRLTRERLVLGTQIIPEIPGFPSASMFYPLLPDSVRAALATVYPPNDVQLGPVQPISFDPGLAYSNWYWAMTPSLLRALVRLAGFEILEECRPEPLFMEIVARPTEREGITPLIDFARRRGLDRIEAFGSDRPGWA